MTHRRKSRHRKFLHRVNSRRNAADTAPVVAGSPKRGNEATATASDDALANAQREAVFREHMAEIGLVLNLPAKRRTRTSQAAIPADESPIPTRWHLRRVIAGATVVVGLAVAGIAMWPEPTASLPPALLGEWSTTHPDFAGKRLIFKSDTIEIGVSESAQPNQFEVTAVRATTSADTTRIVVSYSDDGGTVELNAMLIDGANAQLVMQRPADVVWERRIPMAGR